MRHTPRATIDFESRSECSIERGAWVYSEHPTTEVLCLVYRLPHWPKGKTKVWYPDFPQFGVEAADDPQELFDWILNGGLIEAHGSFFEYCLWLNIMVARYGWPAIADKQWRCSAAKAAAHALPRALEDAVEALRLAVKKDMDGSKVMKKMAKPRKALKRDLIAWYRQHNPCQICNGVGKVPGFKKNGQPTKKPKKCLICEGKGHRRDTSAVPPLPTLWHESDEMLMRLIDYCRVDVLAEEGLSEYLDDLSPRELEIFLLDQTINARGFALDKEAIETALRLIDEQCADLNKELFELTGGAVEKATQRARMVAWLESQGLVLENTKADTLDEILDDESMQFDVTPEAYRGIELMRALGRSSTAKYIKMAEWLSRYGRVHGGLLYHGASTGRWTGKGIQPHNFPKGTLKKFNMEEAWMVLKKGTTEEIAICYESVMEALSNALRGAIVPSPGHQLYVADFAAIECRVLLWAAGQTDALQVFYDGRCPYLDMASSIYGYSCWDPELDLDGNKAKFKTERNMGKPAVLGLGYQMGASKFVESAAGYGITLKEDSWCVACNRTSREHRKVHDHAFIADNEQEITAVKIVDAYRRKMDKVVQMWEDQNDAAVQALYNPGKTIRCGVVTWRKAKDSVFLYCTLPSGRRLAYPFAQVQGRVTPWGSTQYCMTYMGVHPKLKQWMRQVTYGGLLVENIVQAIARDLMAEAMLRIEHSGVYKPVLSVHDEAIAEALIGQGDVKEFEHLVATVPDWGEGCPVEAEGWRGMRYRK